MATCDYCGSRFRSPGTTVGLLHFSRNLLAIVFGPDPLHPSAALRDGVRRTMDGRSGPDSLPQRTARGMASYVPMRSAQPMAAPPVKVYYGPDAADRNER